MNSHLNLCHLQPFWEQWFQLAHVLEGEVKRLEAGDGRLGEVVAVQLAHGQADVALGVTELDPLLLEHLGKLLQLLEVGRLLGRQLHSVVSPALCQQLSECLSC